MAEIGVGEVVRSRSRPDLGELVVLDVFRGEPIVDIGHRVDGKTIGRSWPADDLTSSEEA